MVRSNLAPPKARDTVRNDFTDHMTIHQYDKKNALSIAPKRETRFPPFNNKYGEEGALGLIQLSFVSSLNFNNDQRVTRDTDDNLLSPNTIYLIHKNPALLIEAGNRDIDESKPDDGPSEVIFTKYHCQNFRTVERNVQELLAFFKPFNCYWFKTIPNQKNEIERFRVYRRKLDPNSGSADAVAAATGKRSFTASSEDSMQQKKQKFQEAAIAAEKLMRLTPPRNYRDEFTSLKGRRNKCFERNQIIRQFVIEKNATLQQAAKYFKTNISKVNEAMRGSSSSGREGNLPQTKNSEVPPPDLPADD